jgi:endoglucanase
MPNFKQFTLLIILLFSISLAEPVDIPFHKGFNLTWIWSNESSDKISFSTYGKEDLENIKSLGCDVIRLPLSLRYFADNTLDRTLDPLFFYFLDQVVDWCEELEIYLILDNHTQYPNSSYVPTIADLLPLWRQMAEHYSNRSEYILYETFNEPHNISDDTWKAMQKYVIKNIRAYDSTHTIIVKPIWDSATNYKTFLPVDDDNVIYSFHFYKPFIFTHQGASWTNPPNELAGVPFPASAGTIPECPEELLGSYFETSLASYDKDGTDSAMFAYIQPVLDFADSHNVPIICDEFGVYDKGAPIEDRQRWHKVVIDYFTEKDIPWTLWGYNSSFGIMNKGSQKVFPNDLDSIMVKNMGLIMPEQDTVYIHPDTLGFVIYQDHAPRHIIPTTNVSESKYNYYSQSDPIQGIHCIKFSKPDPYESINFRFWAYRDISKLVEEGASLKFSYKTDISDISIYPRFRNTSIYSPDEPNWRMIYELNEHNSTFDGNWHEKSIPLTQFYEAKETFNGEVIEASGKFSWSLVDMFGFYVTGDKVNIANFYFDNIRIELPGEEVAISNDIPHYFELHPIYPNPFNAQSTISFTLSDASNVKIDIFNIQGKKIDSFTETFYQEGIHQLNWNATTLPSGIYLIRMQSGNKLICRKAGLIK